MEQEKPQSALARLKEEKAEREGNIFAGLSSPVTTEPQENIFAGLYPTGGVLTEVETKESGGRRFVEGVGAGAIHPVRALLPEGAKEWMEEERGLAGTLGEFAGMGLAFIPLYKGASLALTGVGLLKNAAVLGTDVTYLTAVGRSALGLRTAQMARGAGAFAGFETFGGESTEEAPKRFAKGLAEGVAFEAAFGAAAAAWRGKKPKWKPTEGEALPRPAVDPEAHVHPLRLKLENLMRPNSNEAPEITLGKIRAIGTPQEQLHEGLMTLMRSHMPGGQAVLEGLSQKEIVQLYKKATEIGGVTLTPHRRIRGEDLFDVWMTLDGRQVFRPVRLKSGEASWGEIADATTKRFKDLDIDVTDALGSSAGRYTPSFRMTGTGRGAKIEVLKEGERYKNQEGISTLIHELMHHVEWVASGFHEAGRPGRPTLAQIFNLEGLGAAKTLKRGAQLDAIQLELKMASVEARAQQYIAGGFTKKQAFKNAAEDYLQGAPGRPNYYQTDVEHLSRMAEVIYFDPAKAREIAPVASRLVGQLIAKHAPEVRSLMSRPGQVMTDIFDELWRTIDPSKKTTIWAKGRAKASAQQKLEYGKTGWAPGMRAKVNGKEMEFIKKDLETATVRDLSTGEVMEVGLESLQRPVMQNLASRNNEILAGVDKMLDGFPQKIPVNLREDVVEGGKDLGYGIRRALVDTKDYAITDGTVVDWVKSLPESVQHQIVTKYGQIRVEEFEVLLDAAKKGADGPLVEQLNGILDLLGKKGLVKRDLGFLELYVRDPETLIKGAVLESKGFGEAVGGFGDFPLIFADTDNYLKHALRVKGVNETDMPYFFEIAKERFGVKLRAAMGSEERMVEKNVKKAMTKKERKKKRKAMADVASGESRMGVDNAEQTIARAGIQSDRIASGELLLRDSQNKSILAKVPDEDHALAYAKELGSDNVGPPLGDFPGAISHGGHTPPPRPNDPVIPSPSPIENVGRGARLVDAAALGAPWMSALENTAKSIEHLGLGPAYTKVYLPAHAAMLKVNKELSTVARESLGGKTFKDKLQQIQKSLTKVSRARQATVSGHIEAATQEEIAKAGGLMVRAMTEGELKVARFIQHAGLEHDIPRLMSTNRLIDGALSGRLEKVIKKMKGFELSPEAQQVLATFESMPKFKSRIEVLEHLGLTKQEIDVLNIINKSKGKKDKFSIYAVSRYASAPKLRKGFKDGKAQFAFDNKMTPRELNASKFASETLEAGFLDSGLDAKRHLTGYWPHLRKWTSEGFVPDRELIPEEIAAWVASRYRSGELNVYETDTLITVYKHLRGLYMSRHFDPVVPELRKAVDSIAKNDSRSAGVMNEYVLELMGKPHASFDKVQGAISSVSKNLLGKEISPRFASDIVSGLVATASAAAIPFRPALIARNFYESMLKVSPRVGVSHYFRGLKYVVSGDTRKEAFKMAMNASAIRPGTTRLRSFHAAEDVFGPAGPRAISKYLHIFDKGFEWYQSADDWGRAIAYHSQRMRIQDHLDDYVKGRTSMGEFKSRAKVNTFDVLDVQIFEKEILNGNYQNAVDHLGKKLSDEVMVRYGYADHPSGWNSVSGRLFGQFGTWPVQYKDYLMQGVTRGSAKDKIEFATIHGAVTGATIAAGAAVGLNLQTWTGWGMFSGGPYLGMSIDAIKSISGSDLEKNIARRNLYSQVPILGWMETGRPQSILLPGSFLLGDLVDAREALKSGDIFKAVMEGTGVRVMRAEEKNPLDFIYRF